jgi:hypothetical protein
MKKMLTNKRFLVVLLLVVLGGAVSAYYFTGDDSEIEAELKMIRKELKTLRNLNKDVIPEVYDLDMRERPEKLGDIDVEYYIQEMQPNYKWDTAKIILHDRTKAYTINTKLVPDAILWQNYKIIMDYPEYTAMAYFDGGTVSFFPSGEIHINAFGDYGHLLFESKEEGKKEKRRIRDRSL